MRRHQPRDTATIRRPFRFGIATFVLVAAPSYIERRGRRVILDVEVSERETARPSVAADREPVAAARVRAVNQETANA
jgi:hypothetical protein